MEAKNPKTRPEDLLSEKFQLFLRQRGWFVKKTHGNIFSAGWPDLYCAHKQFGQRWVELKIAEHGRLTSAQIKTFQEFTQAGVGVWIITDATQAEYSKLICAKPNWLQFYLHKVGS